MTTAVVHRAHERTNVRKEPWWLAFVRRSLSWLSRVRAVAAARIAGILWARTMRRTRPAREVAWLDGAHPFVVPWNLGGQKAWSWGEGPVVLLVHGWDGRGSQLGSLVEPLVQAGFRVVTFDAPGHGDSVGRRASLVSFADAITATVRRVGPVHALVAHSLGGAASTLALSAGLPVDRVALIAPVDAALGVARFSRFVGLSAESRAMMECNLERTYGASVEAIGASRLAAGMRARALVVHDEDDRWVPSSDGETTATAWPGAQLVVTRGLGHHRILRDPEVIDRVVRFVCVV